MIVLDTSFLVAYRHKGDHHHAAAAPLMEAIARGDHGRVLLPEYVLLELATVLAARAGMPAARSATRELTNAREVEFVHCARFLPHAYALFLGQEKARLSLVDCVLVEIARDSESTAIATFDQSLAAREDVRAIPNT